MSFSVGSPVLWVGFTLVVLTLLAIDLGVFHRASHEVHFREAVIWTAVWITLALLFDGALYWRYGSRIGLEFFTGYLIEYSLSVDNIFVFLLIFRYFGVSRQPQYRVLFWGIIGALGMRAVFILVGAALLHRFSWATFLFGGFVIWAGMKMLLGEDIEVHPDRNIALRLFRKFIRTAPHDFGDRLVVRRRGKLWATPLLLVLIVIEVTDIAFAADSIPAIFAVTRDPFIVFTSNIFAILGLRSLYFVLAEAISKFHYLKWGLGAVLIFVGTKMVVSDWFEISIGISLLVVACLLGVSIVLSLLIPAREAVPSAQSPEKSGTLRNPGDLRSQ